MDMLDANVKRLAYAAMDHAVAFELHVASTAPEGEHVVLLARGDHLDEVLPTARFVAKMAQTFFATKLQGRVTATDGAGPVGFYIVAQLPELEELDLSELSEEGAPPKPTGT